MELVRQQCARQQLSNRADGAPSNWDVQSWLVSLIFHLVLLIFIALVSTQPGPRPITLTLVTSPQTEDEEPQLTQYFYHTLDPVEEVGAHSLHGAEMAVAAAPTIAEMSAIPQTLEEPSPLGTVLFREAVAIAAGPHFARNRLVKGTAGVGTTGTIGAIDRITHEILLSLEQRPTLVVWLFDQSGSLARQRQVIRGRFDRIYDELGIIESNDGRAFRKHHFQPLLTSIIAFGEDVSLRTPKPTDNLDEIKAAVSGIELDESGIERVFTAISMAADRFKPLRRTNPRTGQPTRNVILIGVTDEAGDDPQLLDRTVELCRRFEMPVYVIGVPAPFGRTETLVKWVDPDPRFDQTPQWGRVSQGPESLLPERIKLRFRGSPEVEPAIDSGFGPFGLTRLCYETGGIYFAVHPNRSLDRTVGRRQTADFAAHFLHFFDPDVMRKYRPDYVSAAEYMRRLEASRARTALVTAANMSWITPLESPRTRFVKTGEAALAMALTEAQKTAAKLKPKLDQLCQTMKPGETDREKESTPRWQAAYDLAVGRVLAAKVRTDAYNAMLAKAKRGMKFADEKNNTWIIRPDSNLDIGSQLDKLAEKARRYLNRVVQEHPTTPWSLLAQRELRGPMGWRWEESFTDLDPPRQAPSGDGRPPRPRDDRARKIARPKPKRPVPRL